jgi:hypothetical protein
MKASRMRELGLQARPELIEVVVVDDCEQVGELFDRVFSW